MTAAELKARRLALGLSHRAAAQRLGVAPSSIVRWENGSRAIPPLLDAALRDLEREQAHA